jgi:hypothetical protein
VNEKLAGFRQINDFMAGQLREFACKEFEGGGKLFLNVFGGAGFLARLCATALKKSWGLIGTNPPRSPHVRMPGGGKFIFRRMLPTVCGKQDRRRRKRDCLSTHQSPPWWILHPRALMIMCSLRFWSGTGRLGFI